MASKGARPIARATQEGRAIPNASDIRVSWPVFLGCAGLLLTLVFFELQPGASDGLSGGRLLLFWAAHVFGALAALQVSQMALMRIAVVSDWSAWTQILLSGLIGAVLFTPLASLLDQIFGVGEGEAQGWFLDEFSGLAPSVVLVWVGLNATRLLRISPEKPRMADGSDDATTLPNTRPAFWQRVPDEIGRDLVALSAELHYLRVHTTRGEALILYPFGKAVSELEDAGCGQQIHRSHWVALAYVAEVSRRGQGAVCKTVTDLELPVSRQRRAELEKTLQSLR